MIRFCGAIKHDFEDKVIKLRARQLIIMFLLGGIVLEIIGIILAISSHSKNDLFEFLIYGVITLLLVIALIVSVRAKKNFFEWKFDIFIDDSNIKTIFNHQNGAVTNTPVKKIKKIIDYGEYYLLFLFRWDASHSIICQKDLLIEGSIEEFEKLFEGKIKRLSYEK